MRRLLDLFLDAAQTCLRVLPWPTEPRLLRLGNPGRDAPVLVTGNYDLTVRRVVRALRGQDAYLLIAPTGGINVWCSAAGGHFSTHQVISILRATGVDELVDHRRLILPQLSATGVEPKLLEQRTGWHAVFGPVYARDLPVYLARRQKTDAMRQVRFPLPERLEMGVAWAFPISIIGGTVLALGWPRLLAGFLATVWVLSLGLYALFPWFAGRVEPTKQVAPNWARYLFFFDPRVSRSMGVWLLFLVFLWGGARLQGTVAVQTLGGWSVAAFFLTLLLSMDLAGSTPLYKSGLHEDRLLRVGLNREACRGRALCWEVCPKNCYVIDRDRHKAVVAKPDACVQCGACVVQCPEDALAFFTPRGERIPPEVVRTYKLNLLGSRTQPVGPKESA